MMKGEDMFYTLNLDNIFYKINRTSSERKVVVFKSKTDFFKSILIEYRKYFKNTKNATNTASDWQISGTDLIHVFLWDKDQYWIRNIEYYNGYGRRIDPRNYLVEAMQKLDLSCVQHINYNFIRGRRVGCCNYRYRFDPIPYTGKMKGGPAASRKCRGIKKIYKLAADPDYGKYIRRKALPFGTTSWYCWNDGYEEKRNHESWKKQKKRKQWM
jgi:hypothetical protein